MTVRVPPFLPVWPVFGAAPPPLLLPPLSLPPPPQAATAKARTATSGARVARDLRIRFLSFDWGRSPGPNRCFVFMGSSPSSGAQGVLQSVTEQVESQHGEQQRRPREE